MDPYITGGMIRKLREEKKMTQADLANRLSLSEKTVSRWETGRGYPDITLLEPLADALGISVIELMRGTCVRNTNLSCNMRHIHFYVCPVCGNLLFSAGEAMISCCGVALPPLEEEEGDTEHTPSIESVEDEYCVTLPHEMTKEHYISFLAAVRYDSVEIIKLYPEGDAQARFKSGKILRILTYCNQHGLFRVRPDSSRPSPI